MKFATDRPYSDPEAAARKLVEIANSVEAVQDGRIFIELINGPFLFELRGTPEEYGAGLKLGERARLAPTPRIRDVCEVYPDRAELFA
jgi:hypothetical protein